MSLYTLPDRVGLAASPAAGPGPETPPRFSFVALRRLLRRTGQGCLASAPRRVVQGHVGVWGPAVSGCFPATGLGVPRLVCQRDGGERLRARQHCRVPGWMASIGAAAFGWPADAVGGSYSAPTAASLEGDDCLTVC